MSKDIISSDQQNLILSRLKSQGITDTSVLDIMSTMPRHLFIEPALKNRAYDDDALPIGFSQTISSPYIVAKMTQLLMEEDNMGKVLEIGTGCGYQSAILAKLFTHVTTIERIKPLQQKLVLHMISTNLT